MGLIAAALVTGLGAFFVFHAVGHAPFLRWLFTLLARLHPTLPRCPWCLGAWAALPLAVAVTWPSPVSAVVVWLAGACVAGVLGSLLPDEGA